MMETGIHLPALNALFHGAIPYRDFFFLRGPSELYVPAAMMLILGKNSAVLPVFYYLGTILTFIFCVFIGRYLFRSRLVYYLMILVLVARTFPRISFYYWGGLRYAIGFGALWLFFLFLQKKDTRYAWGAGVVSCLAFLTTIETGLCVTMAAMGTFIFLYLFRLTPKLVIEKGVLYYLLSFFIVLIPYMLYLNLTGAFYPWIESTWNVVRYNHVAYPPEYGVRPENFIDFIAAFNPASRYFKFMTPIFCYLIFAIFMVHKIRTKSLEAKDAFLVGLAIYSLLLYVASFRKIEGHHFEMALQPEKFLLFFMLEEALFFLKSIKSRVFSENPFLGALGRTRIIFINILLIGFVLSSGIYALGRLQHRFPMFLLIKKDLFHEKVQGLSLLENEEARPLQLERAHGMVVPSWQAGEIEDVVNFLKTHTGPQEAVFTYPELGNFNFWADRPFVGRFPIATFTWMYEPWHEELVNDFVNARPKYVIMTKLGHRTFPEEWYFRNKDNVTRFHLVTELILKNYECIRELASVSIYQLKSTLP